MTHTLCIFKCTVQTRDSVLSPPIQGATAVTVMKQGDLCRYHIIFHKMPLPSPGTQPVFCLGKRHEGKISLWAALITWSSGGLHLQLDSYGGPGRWHGSYAASGRKTATDTLGVDAVLAALMEETMLLVCRWQRMKGPVNSQALVCPFVSSSGTFSIHK